MFAQKRIVQGIIIAATVGLLVFLGRGELARPWRSRIAAWLAPPITALERGAQWLRGIASGETGERVQELERERAELLARIAACDATGREDKTLRAALALRSEGESGAIPATVVEFFREGRDELLLLNRGTDDGVGVGDLLLNRERVLGGTVVAADARTARAVLLTSSSRSIDVVFAGTGLRALARGNNSRELVIDLVPQGADVKPGDLILASPRATGGRESLLVGEVREVRQAEHEVFKFVRALHLFDLETDSEVLLLPAP